jgi:N-acetyl-alpha-D-muramate 1-phosphate uridylyltransferase
MNGAALPVAILCGGLATRLRPLTETVPKALIELNGEPFLAHQLRLLASRGIGRAVLCAGYRGEMIRDYVGDGARFGLDAEVLFDGPALLGTAGAVRRALPLLGENFFVLYGDSYLPCDYAAVAGTFLHSGKCGLMTVFRNEGQFDASNVEYSDGHILRYDKKQVTPEMKHIDYGLGVFRAEAFVTLPEGDPCDLAAVYQALLRAGDLAAREIFERFYEIGSLHGLQETAEYLRCMSGTPNPQPPAVL